MGYTKEDSILLGTAIPKGQEVSKQYTTLVNKLRKEGYISGEPYKKTGTLIMRTRNSKQINTVNNNIALIGEAAGFISPSSAEGISYALMSVQCWQIVLIKLIIILKPCTTRR